MSKRFVVLHTLIVIILSVAVVAILRMDVMSSIGDYISGVGSVASVYAIMITLWQLGKVKATSEATKGAVLAKTKEMESLFTLAYVERHVEMSSYISMCIRNNQFQAAALKMEDMKGALITIMDRSVFPSEGSKHLQILIKNMGKDIVELRGSKENSQINNENSILQHVNDASTYLQKVSSIIKNEAYVEKV